MSSMASNETVIILEKRIDNLKLFCFKDLWNLQKCWLHLEHRILGFAPKFGRLLWHFPEFIRHLGDLQNKVKCNIFASIHQIYLSGPSMAPQITIWHWAPCSKCSTNLAISFSSSPLSAAKISCPTPVPSNFPPSLFSVWAVWPFQLHSLPWTVFSLWPSLWCY